MTVRTRLLSLAAVSSTLFAAATDLRAQATTPTLDSLAAAWSAGLSTPDCAPSLSRDRIAQALSTEECVWPRIAYRGGSAQVTGTRYRRTGLASLSWALQMRTRDAALALRDSLGREFRKRGLAEYSCLNEGRRWQRPGLGVEFFVGVVFPDSLLRVGVMATPITDAIPAIMCPDVPKLPGRRPSPTPRRAAAT
jgi:hypothetical protein